MTQPENYQGDLDEEPPPNYIQTPPLDPAADETWALLNHGLAALTTRLDDTENAVQTTIEAIAEAITGLQEQVATLLARDAEHKMPPHSWADRATPADWIQLADWVDWINTRYSIQSQFEIQPCWPSHSGVVEELAGGWRSWQAAVIGDALAKKNGSAELTAWHDRWLWPMLERLRVGHYRINNCKGAHREEVVAYRPTERIRLPTTTNGFGGAIASPGLLTKP